MAVSVENVPFPSNVGEHLLLMIFTRLTLELSIYTLSNGQNGSQLECKVER